MTVSARGNADCIIACLSVASIYLVLTQRHLMAGVLYGLTVHFKIYPVVWCLTLWMFISRDRHPLLPTCKRVQFTVVSLGVFCLLMSLFYRLYGYTFLYEGYLYHSVRKDNRTNFSIYFYFIHLNFVHVPQWMSFSAFLPQVTILLVSLRFYRDLVLALFCQVFFFVLFNKVCAA